MASKKKTLFSILGVVLVLFVALVIMRMLQTVDTSPARMTSAKATQLKAIDQMHAKRDAASDTYNPIQGERSMRDTGHKGVGLFIKNTYFRIAGDMGFDVDKLTALLVPTEKGQPVIIDDPGSFVFTPLSGAVTLSPKALTAVFNQYLADYPDTQMRNLSVKAQPGKLLVDGEVSNVPGVWQSFHMAGPVKLVQNHLFVYNPQKIEVSGLETKGLLNLVNLQLSSLIEIKTGGAKLTSGKQIDKKPGEKEDSGNNITLDLNYALPPPQQDVHVSNMKIDDAGVHLTFTSDFQPDFPAPIVDTDSYVMIQGGDVKTQRALITDVRMQLLAKDGGKLDTSLYNYREQIIGGFFDATTAGELVAYLAPQTAADYIPPSAPQNDENKDEEKANAS